MSSVAMVDSAVEARFEEHVEQRLQAGTLKLPVLPKAIQEVLAMKNNPDFSLNDLSRLIHQDHTLAGHVLRMSNSSIYATNYKTATLDQAVNRLGGQAIVKIAVSITMKGEVFSVNGYEEEVQEIWRHSFATAVLAEDICQMLNRDEQGLYMCGLIHQVGKPVLLQIIREVSHLENMQPAHDCVARLMDKHHTRVGEQIAKSWKMPAAIKAVCMHYGNPEEAEEEKPAVCMTHHASILADFMIHEDEAGLVEELAEVCGQGAFALNPEQVSELLSKKEEVFEMLNALNI